MVKQIETVSIIGLGALGILFGHHLSKRMPPGTLRIIADNNRIENYTRNPVYCNGEKCEFHFVTPDEDTGPADLVIFTVKFGGLDKAIQDMRNQIGKDTIILSALNGISSEEVISRAYGWENILIASPKAWTEYVQETACDMKIWGCFVLATGSPAPFQTR